MKRLLALILAMAMTFSAVMPSVALAAEYSDASSSASSVSDTSLSIQEASSSSEEEKEADQSGSKEKDPGETSQQEEKSSEEKSSGEKSSEEKSSEEKSSEEKSSEEKSSEEKPSEEKHSEEKSSEEKKEPEQDAPSGETKESTEEKSALTPEKETLKSVKESLKTVDGVKYTVTLSYGEDAKIPDGAKLSLVELNQELTKEEQELKENKDRPYQTEKFVSERALEQESFDLHQGLKVRESDYVLFTKFLDISLEKNGKDIQPQAPVTVTIETDALEEGASDALEAAFYNSEATKEWKVERKKLIEEQKEKIKSGKLKEEDARRFPEKVFRSAKITNETQKKKGTKISFETEFVSRLGISGVVKKLKSWKVKDDTVSVYGPRGIKAKVSTESMKAPEAGVEKVRAFSVKTDEKKKDMPDYDVTYWVGAGVPEAEGEEAEPQAAEAAEDSDTGVVISQLKNGKAKKELLGTQGADAPVAIQEGDAIGVAYDTGLREKTLESENVTLEGMLPKNADVTANDMLWRYSRPEDVKEDVNKGEAETLAAYDITIVNKNEEFQPENGESVSVSISAQGIDKDKKVEVWHVGDDGTVEVISDVKVKGDTVSFDATGFSVYMVVQYTVDFHWGEYTYNLEGGSTIFLSELLETLINGASEKEDTTQLKKVRDNFDKIVSVTFTDSELLAIDKVQIIEGEPKLVEDDFSEELIENLRDDWRIVSLKPFTSNEMLTIKMKDGSSVQVPVTDEIWGDDAGETFTSAGGSNALPRVTADGVTYIIRKAAGYADVYAISAGCTIHDYIHYQGTAYPTNDIDQGVGRLTRNTNKMDLELVLRAAEYKISLPKVLTQPETDPASEGFIPGESNTYIDENGEVKPSTYQVWKKAVYNEETNSIEYTMKYFQGMKKKVPLDFIFIYDDSASMYSGVRYTGNPAVRMSETQVTRVMLLDAVKALLDGNESNSGLDYDFRIYLGGTSTGDKRNSLATHPEGFSSYDDVAEYLATYNTGVTDYTVGFENALAMAQASVKNKRTPVVVWLSDFHQGLAGSAIRRTGDYAIADQLHRLARVYGLSTGYRWPNLKVRTVCTGPDTIFNIRTGDGLSDGMKQLENLIKHAIGYYMDNKVTITDNLSDALAGQKASEGDTQGVGSAPEATGKSVWTLGGFDVNEGDEDTTVTYSGHTAATLYTETFTVELDENTVYAGAMPTNNNVTVYTGGEKVNEINESPHKGKGVTFVLGEMDEKDQRLEDTDETPVNKVNGIQFTLTEANADGTPKTGAGVTSYTYTTETVNGVDGTFTIPYTVVEGGQSKVVLELGKNYVLQEDESSVTTYNEGNDSDDNDLKAPDKSWLIKVANNGVVTTQVNGAAGQTPEISIAPAGNGHASRFVIWNQIKVPAILIPIKVQKVWPDDGHKHDPVPFTVYGVNRTTGERTKLKAYDGANAESAKQVRYITGDQDNLTWTQTVYVLDKVGTGEDTTKFFDYSQLLDITDESTLNCVYKIGNTTLTGEGWRPYAVDVVIGGQPKKIVYFGQSYSYDIEEGHLYYEDGWYTPGYGNNATILHETTSQYLNQTTKLADVDKYVHTPEVPEGELKWQSVSDYNTAAARAGQATIATSKGLGFVLDVRNLKFDANSSYLADFKSLFTTTNNTSTQLSDNDAVKQSFFDSMTKMEVVVRDKKDNDTYYKFKIDPVPHNYTHQDWNEGNLFFWDLELPSKWKNYSIRNTTYGMLESSEVYVQEVYATFTKNGVTKTFPVYSAGNPPITTTNALNNTCKWGPDGTSDHWATEIYTVYSEHEFSNVTVTSNTLEVYKKTPKIPPHDIPDGEPISINEMTLSINNTWNPNTLIPVTVKKNWVNADDESVPADVPSDVVALNDPVEFKIEGTTAKGGTKALPLFESNTWTTTDSDELKALTKGSITGDSSASPWTTTVYVPTYDVLGTYDPATRTCEKYADFTTDSLTETSTLKATIDGEERGEWEKETSDYTAGETVYSATVKEWKEKDIHNSGNTAYLVLTFSPNGPFDKTIKSVRVRYYQQQDGSDRLQYTIINLAAGSSIEGGGTYYIPIPFNDNVDYAERHKFKGDPPNPQEQKWAFSEEYHYGIDDRNKNFKVLDSGSGEQTWTLTTSKPQSGTQLGYESLYSIWQLPAIDHVTEPTFTLTNTFHPNVPVQLSSTFTDSTNDHASTGMIKSVVYTIEGTTEQGKEYSREVVTTGTPTSNTEGGESTTLSANTSTIYVPKGIYTITQTAYTLDGSTRYATTAYTTAGGTSRSAPLSNTASVNTFSFSNTRKSLPITVQTHFDPGLTDDDIVSPETRPMQHRTLNYALSYTTGNGTPATLSDSNYALNDSNFDQTSRNYTNTHTDGKVPTYSVFAELTECKIAPENITAALPDYMMSIISEEKDGKLVFTIEATVNRAPIIVTKSWDEDISADERAGVTLNFSIRRSDGKVIYGTDQRNVGLDMTTDENGEAYNTFSLGTDAEQTVIYLPAIRSTDLDANGNPVRYILTETSATKGSTGKTYYVNYADLTGNEENHFEQTKPGKQSGEAGEENTNEARFVLTSKGITIDVNNANNPYICKIVETFGTGSSQSHVEVPFRTLNKAVDYARKYGDGTAMSATHPVVIQMLVDYEMPGDGTVIGYNNDKVVLKNGELQLDGSQINYTDNIILTTAATSSDLYNFAPTFTEEQGRSTADRRDAAIIKRKSGYETSSMFTVQANASFTTENIVFDGGAVFDENGAVQTDSITANVNGGIVNVAANGTLTVGKGSTMQNTAVNGNGGAIYAEGTVTVSGSDADGTNSVLFQNCSANRNGAIYTEQTSALSVSNATFSYCSAINGSGGIGIKNTASTFTTCCFDHCTSMAKSNTDGDGGGAIQSNGGSMTLTSVEFSYCSSVMQGGAVYHKGGGTSSFSATGCTFTNCQAGNSDRDSAAGAAETQAKTVSVDSCVFRDCTSNKNAGAFNVYNTGATIEIKNSSFTRCKTTSTKDGDYGNGGALRTTGSKTTVENCTFDSCEAMNRGGAIHCKTNTTIKGTTLIKDCKSTLIGGGGVYLEGGTLTIESGTIQNCSAPDGGGIYQAGGTCDFTGGSISNCVATKAQSSANGYGGGIYLNKGTFTLNGGAISDCKAVGSGGGIYLGSDSNNKLYLKGGTVSESKASGSGGGVYLGGGKFEFTSGRVRQCIAKTGGGIYANVGKNTQVPISASGEAIVGCEARNVTINEKTENGVTTYTATPATDKDDASKPVYNTDNKGGGLYLAQGTLNITNATIKDNKANTGGGIYQHGGTLTMNSTASVVGNEANGGDGGGINLGGGTLTMDGGNVQANKAKKVNSDGGNGGGIYLEQPSGVTSTFNYNAGTIGGSVDDEGNTAVNGGGIYQDGGKLTMDGGQIKGNKADEDGGGVYLGGGEFKLNKKSSSDDEGVIGIADSNDGVTYAESEKGNRAKNGGGLYVADGVKVYILGGKISGNRVTELGGGIATGGDQARLYFSGNIQVFDNYLPPSNGKNVRSDVCLDYDSNEIINTTSPGLERDSHIGVYVTNKATVDGEGNPTTLYEKHGKGGKPFGTFKKENKEYDSNLNRFINNRSGDRFESYDYYYGVRKGEVPEDPNIYWAEYICKITDGSGNLLFENKRATSPALYQYLGHDGAFDALGHVKQFYTKDGEKADPVYVKMLVNEYSLRWPNSVTWNEEGVNTITLTVADLDDPDFNGDRNKWNGECVIKRGNCTSSMFATTSAETHFTLKNIELDGEGYHASTSAYIEDNPAANVDGSLIAISGDLTLDGSILKNAYTKASGNKGGNGGAILMTGPGTLTMRNNTFEGKEFTFNELTYRVPTRQFVAKIEHCHADNGAALYVNASTATTEDPVNVVIEEGALISGCTAKNGLIGVKAGIVNLNSALNANTDISDTTRNVIDCNVTEKGGLAYVNGGTLNVNNKVSHFTAPNGGAVYLNGNGSTLNLLGTQKLDGTLEGASIVQCTATSNGGAVYLNGNGTILNLLGVLKSDGTVESASIEQCTATSNGGGVYVNKGTLNMVPTVEYPNITPGIRNCQAAKGGAIFENETEAKVNFSAGEISDNTATSLGGGAIRIEGGGQATISGTAQIKNNKVTGNNEKYGAAVNIKKGTLTVSGGTISGNKFENTNNKVYGGAIYVSGNGSDLGTLFITGGTITGNTANGTQNVYGGAISLRGVNASATISGGTITGNSATVSTSNKTAYGGALALLEGANLTLTGGTITGNTASGTKNSHGAGIYLDGETKNDDGDVTIPAAKLEIQGTPDFGGRGTDAEGNLVTTRTVGGKTEAAGNFVTLAGYSEKQNGQKDYPSTNEVRQDIYVAEGDATPASIKLTGDLVNKNGQYIGDGTIWVWAEHENHHKQLMPFAVLGDNVVYTAVEEGQTVPNGQFNAARLKAFRNAQDDSTTENGTDSYLYGSVEGDVKGLVYWSGVSGHQKVILKKVGETSENSTSNYYKPLEGAKFTIYKGSSVYKLKNGEKLENLPSSGTSATGIIWIGELPYGTYYLKETTAPSGYTSNENKLFCLIVDETGVWISEEGYEDKGDAENDAKNVKKKALKA